MGDATADCGGSNLYITCTISYNIDFPRGWKPNTCSQIRHPSPLTQLRIWTAQPFSPRRYPSRPSMPRCFISAGCLGCLSFSRRPVRQRIARQQRRAHPENGHRAGIAGPEMQSSKFQIIIQASQPRDHQSERTNACRTELSSFFVATLSDLCILLTTSSTAIQKAPLPLYSLCSRRFGRLSKRIR
jgi:hypothetical protein